MCGAKKNSIYKIFIDPHRNRFSTESRENQILAEITPSSNLPKSSQQLKQLKEPSIYNVL